MDELKNVKGATINFNLRQPHKKGATILYAVVYVNRHQYKIATGCKIEPWLWDAQKQLPIIKDGMCDEEVANAKTIFNKILEIKLLLSTDCWYLCKNKLNILNIFEMKVSITSKNVSNSPKKATKALEKAIDLYKDLNSRIKKSSLKTYTNQLATFKKYCNSKGKDSIKMLTEKGLKEFEIWMRRSQYSETTIRNSIQVICILINKVIKEHPHFAKYGISKVCIDLPKAKRTEDLKCELTEEEINALRDCQVTDKQAEYRDLFLMACYTGQRASDLPALFEANEPVDGFFVITTKKQNVTACVEATREVMELRERYKDGFKYIDIHKPNLSKLITNRLKVVAEKANLNRMISYVDNRGNCRQKPLYEVISSHFGRHTFVTWKSRKGEPLERIQYMTGHKGTQSLTKYYTHLSNQDKINLIKTGNKSNEHEIRIDRNNINSNTDLIKEAKEALYCLGASLDDLADINDLHTLNKLLYNDFHNRYMDLGCNMDYIKKLYLSEDTASLTEKRELIRKVLEEAKAHAL